jgi:hypothetical protein
MQFSIELQKAAKLLYIYFKKYKKADKKKADKPEAKAQEGKVYGVMIEPNFVSSSVEEMPKMF